MHKGGGGEWSKRDKEESVNISWKKNRERGRKRRGEGRGGGGGGRRKRKSWKESCRRKKSKSIVSFLLQSKYLPRSD